jgi:hypothetical protein
MIHSRNEAAANTRGESRRFGRPLAAARGSVTWRPRSPRARARPKRSGREQDASLAEPADHLQVAAWGMRARTLPRRTLSWTHLCLAWRALPEVLECKPTNSQQSEPNAVVGGNRWTRVVLARAAAVIANPLLAYTGILVLQLRVIWNVWHDKDLTIGDTSAYYLEAVSWAHGMQDRRGCAAAQPRAVRARR